MAQPPPPGAPPGATALDAARGRRLISIGLRSLAGEWHRAHYVEGAFVANGLICEGFVVPIEDPKRPRPMALPDWVRECRPDTPGAIVRVVDADGESTKTLADVLDERKAARQQSPGAAGMSGIERPEIIRVACGQRHGILLPGKRQGRERVLVVRKDVVRGRSFDSVDLLRRNSKISGTAKQQEMSPSEFAGIDTTQPEEWKERLRVQVDGAEGPAVGEWLLARGNERGSSIVDKRLNIFWPNHRAFYRGTVDDFNPDTGEHSVRYDGGQVQEWLHLSLQVVDWGAAVVEHGAGAA